MNAFRLPILRAVPALLVAVTGVALAWLAFRVTVWIALLLVALPIAIGWAQFWRGRRRLPANPVGAVKLMEWFVLVPGVVVAAVSGLLIGLGVFLEPAKEASLETKKLLAATSAALGGFLTAAFVKSAEDADAEWVGEIVKAELLKAYEERFDPGSDGAKALTSNVWRGLSGWGREARGRRAEEIGRVLASSNPGSEP